MAERPTQFSYRNIHLYKSESLGSGSYGGVCKAKCDGLLCAAKSMHPTLFDLRDPGTASYLRKFREECHLLSLARHPNVVQYLGTYTDPDTRLPVLLMELCDESLTAFLERSPGPLSYHIQVNICHDIALALVYLHSNGLIHRDLTGNNVLFIAGIRAKITDFGMSKLVNPRMTALTLCPGNQLYMSPEALDEAKLYTAKLDVFSFGVIVIQILTRQFPNPTDRFRHVSVAEFEEQVRVVVPDSERRKAHLQLIPEAHSLKPLALQCLKKKENERQSALQLCERLSELKQSSQYRESREQAEHSSEIQQLQLQLRGNMQEAREQQTRITELENTVDGNHRQLLAKDRQLQEQQHTFHGQLQQKDRQLQQNQHAIASSDEALERKERELQQTQQLVSEFQQKLHDKNIELKLMQAKLQESERAYLQHLKLKDKFINELKKAYQHVDMMLKPDRTGTQSQSWKWWNSWFRKIMDEIPLATNTDILLESALTIIRLSPEEVYKGMGVYQELRKQGKVMFFKLRYVYWDKSNFPRVAELIKESIDCDSFSFKTLITCLTNSKMVFKHCRMDDINVSHDKTVFLFSDIHSCEVKDKYNIAVCFLKIEIENSVSVIGGLITERCLGKDSENKLYLQI